MKKLLIVLLLLFLYLNRAYAYFYDNSGKSHLSAPIHDRSVILGSGQSLKIVALGDSLTEGVGATEYNYTYPYQIAEKLSVNNKIQLINLAQVGDSSLDLLTNQLQAAVNEKPDMVTLLIGINDLHNLVSTWDFEKNLLAIVKPLKSTGAKVYLINIPYLGSSKIVLPPYNFLLDFRTRQYNEIIKKVSVEMEVNYIDLYTNTRNSQIYSLDQFHPSDQGYLLWSKILNVN